MKIRACIFDLGGTIVDRYYRTPFISLKNTFNKYGIILSDKLIYKDMGMYKLNHIQEIMKNPYIKSIWKRKHGIYPSKKEEFILYSDFIETQKRLGSPKYAFLPIGAYDPEWFMSASHVNPEDSIRIMKDLGAEFSFGMHWGTFTLTAEDTLEPPQRLKEALKNDKLDNFITLKPGEVVYLQ